MPIVIASLKAAAAAGMCLGVAACGWTDLVIPHSAAPNAAVDRECQAQARAYVRNNVLDKYWREHEYDRQYRACLANRE